MATQKEPIDTQQPENNLTSVAEKIRKTLLTKNNFTQSANEYGVTNPDAVSDGDSSGRGTGVFLDVLNGGTKEDNIERKQEIKINQYSSVKPYSTPSS
jgi:hypothetical protein